jgi:sulfoxide reductase catalytic subunit YedY
MRRREFLASGGTALAALATGALDAGILAADTLVVTKKTATTTDPPTPYKVVTTFNNFYEFGIDKGDPAKHSKAFKPRPWSVAVEGACGKPGVYTLEDILKPHPLEERIYRHRCVEGWSIVVPWVGFPLADLLKRFEPGSNAKFVEFVTVKRPEEMPAQRARFMSLLPWPYSEGLRLDEALHPLTLMAVGLYGEELPNQNGAPLRLIVPWKYGFKGVKSIVKMRFVDKQPINTWQAMARNEYGFYANVNPMVDHPRWSQAREKRLPSFIANHKTEMFNGYADQVQSLYAGMDLRRNF